MMETPVSKSRPDSSRVVRVVGKIRPFLDSEAQSCPISMTRSTGGHASIRFGDQSGSSKDCCKLDWCYDQDETVSDVFSKEVKPLLHGLWKGINSCVVAYGARGSGKTQLIQGTKEKPGLVLMTIHEIFPVVTECKGSINVSIYEVYQDHVYDLLEPKEKEVLVMEDANQRIQLKGLSKIPMRSISQFKDLFSRGCNVQRPSQHIANDVTFKSHRGLIIYVSCVDKESKQRISSKMNFVDLAGYEDIKKNSIAKSTLTESAKVNKSLYALLNVVQAVNSSGNYVPYRESKLTRLMQDFICGSASVVVVTCMNPVPCPDTIRAVHLASRSCQVANHYQHDSVKNCKSISRLIPSCSPKGRITTLDASLKKLDISHLGSVEKKGYGTPSQSKRRFQPLGSSFKRSGTSFHASVENANNLSMMKGRKLLNLTTPTTKLAKEICVLGVDTNRQHRVSDLHVGVDHGKTEPNVNVNDNGSLAIEAGTILANKYGNTEDGNTEGTDVGVVLAVEVDTILANEHEKIPLNVNDDGCLTIEEDTISANEYGNMEDTEVGVAHETTYLKVNESESLAVEVDTILANEQSDSEDTDIGPGSNLSGGITKNWTYNAVFDDDEVSTPGVTDKLREISNSLKLWSSKPISISMALDHPQTLVDLCPSDYSSNFEDIGTPQDKWRTRSTGLKKSLAQECLSFLNIASKEELKSLKGIGEKRATYILELREQTPEPFKEVDDLKDIGLSSKQIRGLMSKMLEEL